MGNEWLGSIPFDETGTNGSGGAIDPSSSIPVNGLRLGKRSSPMDGLDSNIGLLEANIPEFSKVEVRMLEF
jgi:hypothetical protein